MPAQQIHNDESQEAFKDSVTGQLELSVYLHISLVEKKPLLFLLSIEARHEARKAVVVGKSRQNF